ncbi:hypothetical protein AgCh_039690 [Apium graveolens]
MGNTNQKTSGELKKKKNSDDNNAMVKKFKLQLQLDKSPVFTMFTLFINNVKQQVQLFKANPVLSKFGNLLAWQTVNPPPPTPQKLPQQTKTNSLALWQASAVGGYFILRWAWAKWNEQRTKKKSSDDPF